MPFRDVTPGNGTEPLVGQAARLIPGQIAGHGQHGIIGRIVAKEEILHLVQRGLGDVAQLLADGRPAVRMHPISQRAHQVTHIAVWLVEAALLELLHHHTTLHLQAPRTESQLKHTVGLQPETYLGIVPRHSEVIVGDVIVGPRIVLPAGLLQGRIIIRDMHRSPEHEMFKQMGKAGVVGVLVEQAIDELSLIEDYYRSECTFVTYILGDRLWEGPKIENP